MKHYFFIMMAVGAAFPLLGEESVKDELITAIKGYDFAKLTAEDIDRTVATFITLDKEEQKEVRSLVGTILEDFKNKLDRNGKSSLISFGLELGALSCALWSIKGAYNSHYRQESHPIRSFFGWTGTVLGTLGAYTGGRLFSQSFQHQDSMAKMIYSKLGKTVAIPSALVAAGSLFLATRGRIGANHEAAAHKNTKHHLYAACASLVACLFCQKYTQEGIYGSRCNREYSNALSLCSALINTERDRVILP